MGRWDHKDKDEDVIDKIRRMYRDKLMREGNISIRVPGHIHQNPRLYNSDIDDTRPFTPDSKLTQEDLDRDWERDRFLKKVKNANKYCRKKKLVKPKAKRKPKKVRK